MSVMDMNSRMAMAEKLSVQQLQQAIQSGSLPAYIGIPLIEQKNKEKSQMAAAQQGQQKPPSVAASILQQAEQQEQQEQGISQLPSNLPVMEGEEMGMAEGGIIAFSERGRVEDPDRDPYEVQDIEGGRYDPRRHPRRGRYDMNGPLGDLMNLGGDTPEGRAEAEQRARDRQAMKNTLADSGEGINKLYAAGKDVLSMPVRAVAGAGESVITRPLRAMGVPIPYLPESFYGGDRTSMTPFMDKLRKETAARSSSAAPETAEASTQGSLTEGITPASIAASEAALPKPTGTGPRTAPQGGAPNSGRNALPPTLAAAERSDSPAADRATSMLDKYIAQLEKSGESVGRDKKEAMYMALIQGGLAAAGGMSPNALQNIAQGATLGAQNYQQAMRDIKKEDRARIEKLINAGLSKEKLGMELRKLGIEDKKADAMINYYNARAGAAGAGGGSDAKNNTAYNLATTAYNKNVSEIDKQINKLAEDPNYKFVGKSPDLIRAKKGIQDRIDALEQRKTNAYKQYRGYVTDRLGIDIPDFSGAPSNAPEVGTVKDGYKFKGGNPGDPKSWEKV